MNTISVYIARHIELANDKGSSNNDLVASVYSFKYFMVVKKAIILFYVKGVDHRLY